MKWFVAYTLLCLGALGLVAYAVKHWNIRVRISRRP